MNAVELGGRAHHRGEEDGDPAVGDNGRSGPWPGHRACGSSSAWCRGRPCRSDTPAELGRPPPQGRRVAAKRRRARATIGRRRDRCPVLDVLGPAIEARTVELVDLVGSAPVVGERRWQPMPQAAVDLGAPPTQRPSAYAIGGAPSGRRTVMPVGDRHLLEAEGRHRARLDPWSSSRTTTERPASARTTAVVAPSAPDPDDRDLRVEERHGCGACTVSSSANSTSERNSRTYCRAGPRGCAPSTPAPRPASRLVAE